MAGQNAWGEGANAGADSVEAQPTAVGELGADRGKGVIGGLVLSGARQKLGRKAFVDKRRAFAFRMAGASCPVRAWGGVRP
jgi:hypothetical protein